MASKPCNAQFRDLSRNVGRLILICALVLACASGLRAHDPSAVPLSWNREISRLVFDKCASCHRPDGTSFSLMTYQDAQPRLTEIKESVLARQMPPWGAVKGFGDFRNDQGLTQEQIALVTDWVEGGATRGGNRNVLPPTPKFETPSPFTYSTRRDRRQRASGAAECGCARRRVSRADSQGRIAANRRRAARRFGAAARVALRGTATAPVIRSCFGSLFICRPGRRFAACPRVRNCF